MYKIVKGCFIDSGVCYFWPALCSNSENATTTESTTEVPDYYDGDDYEEYDYDNYGNNF